MRYIYFTGNSEIVNASESTNGSTHCMHLTTTEESSVRVCQRNASTAVNHQECDSYLKPVKIWGATLVIFANLIYIVPYLIIIVLYFAVAKLRKRAYSLCVLCYNATQALSNVWMIFIGRRILCHEEVSPTYQLVFGLVEVFTTVSSMLWMTAMCLDITLSITRFRWKSAAYKNSSKEFRKFLKYAAFVWGVTGPIVVVALIFEVTPGVPKVIRPQLYGTMFDGRNDNVLLYALLVPVFAAIVNNVLFVYTSIKMVKVKKETRAVNENREQEEKDLYFVFAKMYMLMDAPWISGALSAIFPNLWLLKFIRMSQPMLMLIAILPREMMPDRLFCKKKRKTKSAVTNNIGRQV